MNRDMVFKSIILIVAIGLVAGLWYSFSVIDRQASEIDSLKAKNKEQKERIETLGDINQDQTRTLKKSDYEKIRESANVFVQSVFTIKESGYEKRKEDGSAVVSQRLREMLFPENRKQDDIKYQYTPDQIKTYIDQREDQANVYVTFLQRTKNMDNDTKQKSHVTLEVSMEKQGDTWIIDEYTQLNEEDIK